MTSKESAKLDNVPLHVEFFEDSFERAIAVHEHSRANGATTQDLGAKARRIKFRCYFWDAEYSRHADLVAAITVSNGSKMHELVHESYGLVKGRVASVNVRNDERNQTAEIDIEFIEDLLDNMLSVRQVGDVRDQAEAAFTVGQAQQMLQAADDLIASIGTEANQIIGATLDPALSLVAQFASLSVGARAVLGVLDTALAEIDAIAATSTIPTSALVSTIDYGSTLPGKIVETAANAAARQVQSMQELAGSPAAFVNNLASTFDAAEQLYNDDVYPVLKHIKLANVQALALECAYRYSEDEGRRGQVRQMEAAPSFDWSGTYVGTPVSASVMTVDDLEATLKAVNQRVQSALSPRTEVGDVWSFAESARMVAALKEMSRTLLDHVQIVKLERERIVERDYSVEMPLHLVCLREGLPHNYAERVLALNPQVRNPTFANGALKVYAPA